MRAKLTNKIRPEFRKLIKEFKSLEKLREWLGDGMTKTNILQCKWRGYLPVKFAQIAENKSGGKYKAKLLAKRGEL